MTQKHFIIEKTVPEKAIDGLGHVNNIIYVKWIQAVSIAPWEAVIPEQI